MTCSFSRARDWPVIRFRGSFGSRPGGREPCAGLTAAFAFGACELPGRGELHQLPRAFSTWLLTGSTTSNITAAAPLAVSPTNPAAATSSIRSALWLIRQASGVGVVQQLEGADLVGGCAEVAQPDDRIAGFSGEHDDGPGAVGDPGGSVDVGDWAGRRWRCVWWCGAAQRVGRRRRAVVGGPCCTRRRLRRRTGGRRRL